VVETPTRLIDAWNEPPNPANALPGRLDNHRARRAPLKVYCPACRTTREVDLPTLDRHRDAAITSLIPSLSCRSCRPHAPFADLVRLSVWDGIENTERILGDWAARRVALNSVL
jgi:hypothetical protein